MLPVASTGLRGLSRPSGPVVEANPNQQASADKPSHGQLREAFGDFVGQTFFSQLLAEMRKSVNKSEYFHGGQGEEIFQGQMDQVLAERLRDSTAEQFSGPMFELFMMRK